MPPPTGKISQAEFIKNLKDRIPELAPFPDHAVMERVLKEDPTVRDRVDLPDDVAAREQARLTTRSHSLVDPSVWENHPNIKSFTNSVLGTLPVLGGVAGATLATPETLGTGTLVGGALGVGAGRGARDLIAQGIGLEDTDPVEKAGNIAWDTAIAGVTPGLIDSALHPIQASKVIAGGFGKWGKALTPASLRRWGFDFGEPLREWAETKPNPLIKPSWQMEPPFPPEKPPDFLKPTGTGAPSTPAGPPDLPWKVNAPPTPPRGLSPTGTSTPPAPTSNEPLTFGVGGPRVRVPGASGTGTPEGPVPDTPTPWSMRVKESPIGPSTAPSVPSAEGITIHGNEERVIRDNWDMKTLHHYMEQGFKPAGKTAEGKSYMSRPIEIKKTSSIEPIIQHSPSTGKIRGSLDGGQTWKYSNDEGDTWSEQDV